MSRIAIITGASSGLGVEFYKEIQKEALDEIWIIARREGRLNEIASQYGKIKTRVISMDITLSENVKSLKELFEAEKPDIRFFVNNAGFGVVGNLDEADYVKQGQMVDLNVKALTELSVIALPFMSRGSYLINTCSIASFVPNARMTVYSSTKAYVMSFTRALRYELRKKKINVTAVCPGPMSTEFLNVAGIEKGVSKTFDTLPYCNPAKTARGGIKAAKRGRCVYTPRGFYKFYRVLAKVVPASFLMGAAKV
ncbi:MAG: SDR family NAD(P)-dependent oxidoreductase [Clostridia bacterium]|nr:SDR family NAD(P)-dependent oxidoreductase [Clostridia bacterium]